MQLTSRIVSMFACAALAACGDATAKNDAAENDAGLPPVDAAVSAPDAGVSAVPDAGSAPEDASMPRAPEITFINVSPPALTVPRDLSADGRLALFETIGEGGLYLVDVESGAAEHKATLTFVDRNQALGMSSSGTIVAENGYPVQASVWSDARGWRELGSPFAMGCLDASTSELTDIAGAWDISADGRVIVGLAYDVCTPKAFSWYDDGSAQGVFTSLELLGVASPFHTEPPNRATVVSDDGRVIGGWAENGPVDRSPAIWRADGSGFLLDPSDMDAPGEILSISADGNVVAGVWANEGFMWTEAEGRVELGRLPETLPFDGVFPNAMAKDGGLLFGTNGGIAFVWTRSLGMRPLAPIVRAHVALAEGVSLTNVMRASADGSVLIGSAFDTVTDPRGINVGFVLELPAAAYGL